MTFNELPPGAKVFLDANTLVYHLAPDPAFGPACTELLLRIQRQDVAGYTSTHILSEVAHRLMTLEAVTRFVRPMTGIAYWLRRHPGQVQELTTYRQALAQVPFWGLQVLTIPIELIDAAAAVSQETGLLSNDALLVAVMRHYGLNDVASADTDLDRAGDLARYQPA